MTQKTKIVVWIGASVVLVAAIGAGWIWKTRSGLVKEVALDLKAGAMSRHAENPFERFLELRYGPMTEPINRQKAFLGFFDADHMEGMRRLVGYMKPGERETNIAASARWIANYRESMSDPEKQSLAEWLHSEQGRVTLQRSSALYRSRDVWYRASTEPVIRELMTTFTMLHQQGGEK